MNGVSVVLEMRSERSRGGPSVVAWCGKLNAIVCASETCARIPK
ncbi:hypothetical protein HanPSC8_Chr09g0379251 [Helianthus annuus]|nr:hypothetical protein HanPSC8_Chr09g0379251 [Helianthus annuus]